MVHSWFKTQESDGSNQCKLISFWLPLIFIIAHMKQRRGQDEPMGACLINLFRSSALVSSVVKQLPFKWSRVECIGLDRKGEREEEKVDLMKMRGRWARDTYAQRENLKSGRGPLGVTRVIRVGGDMDMGHRTCLAFSRWTYLHSVETPLSKKNSELEQHSFRDIWILSTESRRKEVKQEWRKVERRGAFLGRRD